MACCTRPAVDWRARALAAEPAAAQWAKIAPLIERLRDSDYWDPDDIADLVDTYAEIDQSAPEGATP